MTLLTCTRTGQSITLLGEPKISGEAKVWRTNHNGYLAKIYHSATPEHVQKLAVMIAHRPKEPNSHLNHISFAWPKSVLKDAQANCVGFLMPEIKDAKELIDVYNPKKRKDSKLDVDWRFLHTTALNIASIIEAIHIPGYVLGDIKQQNILVNDRALPSIIDTDSFQVRNPVNGNIYHCPVGSPDYTPPELIDQDFSSIAQTEVHDRFRLAVIIYQLLFGETPFAGKWIGAGETPETNELIRQGLWLYAPNSLIQPVERTIPLEIVHPEVQRCFLRCFNDGYKNSNLRPTARDWVKALRLAVNELTICGKVDSHYYSQTYGKCYWCDRSIKLRVDIFPGFVRPKQAAVVESTSEQISTLQGHFDWVLSVAFSPDGKTLASGSYDKNIKLWNVAAQREICTLQGHSKSVNSVAFSPDGKTLASGSEDKTIKLWDVVTQREIHTLQGHSKPVNSVAFSPNGDILVSGGYNTIKLWNIGEGKEILPLQGYSTGDCAVAYSPDGKTIASSGFDNMVNLSDVLTGAQNRIFQGHSDLVRCVVFSPDGKILVSASQDHTIKLWNVRTGTEICTLKGHSNSVFAVAYSPDSKTLISGGADKTIKLWNLETRKEIITFQGHSSSISSVAYSPDGKNFASASIDHTIKIWQLTSSTTTTTSSSVQPTQSQVSQTNPSANLPSPNNYSKQSIFQSAIAQNTSSSGNPTSAKNQTSNKAVNNTSQKSSTTSPFVAIFSTVFSMLGSAVLRSLIPSGSIWWVLGAFFIIIIILIIITNR